MRRPDAWGRSQRLDCSGAVAGTVCLAGGRRPPCAALRFAASETVPCCLVGNFVLIVALIRLQCWAVEGGL